MSTELKATTIELATKLKDYMTIEEDKIVVTNDAFEKTLPEDLSADQVKKVFNHVSDVTAAFTYAVGDLAEEACNKTESITDVEGKMKMLGNHGAITASYSQHATRPTSVTDRTPVDVYGGMRTRVKMSAQNNSGELAKVRSTIAARGASLFAKK